MGGLAQTAPHSPFPKAPPNLVEQQGLADVAPAAGASSSCEQSRKQTHEEQGAPGGPGADEEHHEQAGSHTQQAGVPGEQAEGGAGSEKEAGRELRVGHSPGLLFPSPSSFALGMWPCHVSPEVGG